MIKVVLCLIQILFGTLSILLIGFVFLNSLSHIEDYHASYYFGIVLLLSYFLIMVVDGFKMIRKNFIKPIFLLFKTLIGITCLFLVTFYRIYLIDNGVNKATIIITLVIFLFFVALDINRFFNIKSRKVY